MTDQAELIDVEEVEWGDVRLLVETLLTTEVPAADLVSSAFCFAFDDQDRLLMVRLADRDWHPTGGHRLPDETPEQAATRETLEEGGVAVDGLVPVGVQRITVKSEPPADWRYPVPISYQVFFTGRAARCEPRAGTEAIDAAFMDRSQTRATDWIQRWPRLYEAALSQSKRDPRPDS